MGEFRESSSGRTNIHHEDFSLCISQSAIDAWRGARVGIDSFFGGKKKYSEISPSSSSSSSSLIVIRRSGTNVQILEALYHLHLHK